MKAVGKHSARLRVVEQQQGVNSQAAMNANTLIGYDAQETVKSVADVLDFVMDYEQRQSAHEMMPSIHMGKIRVLEFARDALRLQERELDRALSEGNANG